MTAGEGGDWVALKVLRNILRINSSHSCFKRVNMVGFIEG